MTSLSVEAYTEKQLRAVERVLDILDRIDLRTDRQFQPLRAHERNQFRGQIAVCIPDQTCDFGREAWVQVNVWARSVSLSGLAFIHPGAIHTQQIYVGLPLPDAGLRWFRAEIVRRREIPNEEFWEYGITFRGRVDRPPLGGEGL